MKIKKTDINEYSEKDIIEGTGIFANALTKNLRHMFPQRDIKVNHTDPYHQGRIGKYSGRQIISRVYEVVGKKFGIFPKKRILAILATDRDLGGNLGVSIPPIDLRQIVQNEVEKLNQISGANKPIDLISEKDYLDLGKTYF